MNELTHLDAEGHARMVDVSGKATTAREALAAGLVRMTPTTRDLAMLGGARKGEVIAAAEIAGVMAAKKTASLIPLCHPLPIAKAEVRVRPVDEGLEVTARVATMAQTGVEMEAMTAVSIACLTLYDMLKAVERGMTIEAVRLLEKTGGASGDWRRSSAPPRVDRAAC
jgi:cyclic pyranopterin monophosphate synthase